MSESDLPTDTIREAKERATRFIDEVRIKGKDSQGDAITTNLDYLKHNLDRLLTF